MVYRFLSGVTTALVLGSAAVASTPIAGGVSFGVEIFALNRAVLNNNGDVAGWNGVPEYSSLGVDAAVNYFGNRVSAFSGGDATWDNADSGSLVYNGGWRFDAPDAVAAGQGARLNFSTDPDWFYSFVSSVDGMFEMDYAIIGIGDTAGLRGWQFAWNNGSRTLGGDALDPTESGDVRFSVLRGGTYRVSLTNLAQIETLGNLAGVRGQMDGNFNWRIVENAVPEPASWTLMILGFGLTGASLRQTSSRKSVRIG